MSGRPDAAGHVGPYRARVCPSKFVGSGQGASLRLPVGDVQVAVEECAAAVPGLTRWRIVLPDSAFGSGSV